MPKQRILLQPRGIVPDQPGHFVGPESWTGGENVSFRAARIQRVGGLKSVWQDASPFLDDPQHLLYSPNDGVAYWVMCSNDKMSVTDGVTHTAITPAGGLASVDYNQWVSSQLNGLGVFTNGADMPIYWGGNTVQACETLPDWPVDTVCYSLRPCKFFLIGMNIDGPSGLLNDYLVWSDAAAPGQVPQSWTAGTDSQAGDNVLGDETGPILDGLALRDDFIIYKRHATYIMTYVGGAEVMAFRKLWTGVGLLTKNCVAELNGFHYMLADGDIMVHDGQTIRSIADDRIRETLFTLMDNANFQNSYVVANPTNNEVYFCIPTGGIPEARYALIYHVDSDVWGTREIPSCPHGAHGIVPTDATAAEEPTWEEIDTFWQYTNRKWNETSQTIGTVNDGVLWAQPDGYNGANVLMLDADVQANGLTVDSLIAKDSFDMGSPGQVKIIRKIWPRITAPNGAVFTIRVGGQVELGDGIALSSRTFTVGQDDWADFTVMGKYISLQISTEQDIVWQLTGVEIEFELRGRF